MIQLASWKPKKIRLSKIGQLPNKNRKMSSFPSIEQWGKCGL